MIRKILAVFTRDLKVSFKDFIALYIILFPVLFALAINAFVPGLNDTTVNLGLLTSDDLAAADYYGQFANVEQFDTIEALHERINKRDALLGIVEKNGKRVVIAQGNEPTELNDYAKMLASFRQLNVGVEDSTATIVSMNRSTPPIKKIFVNGALMFTSVIGGMLILLNIIEEKVDNTISAVNVSTLTRGSYIIGKSLIGIVIPIIGSIIMLYMTGFSHVNFLQLIIVMLTMSVLSVVVGFVMGLTNDDVMNAAGNMKMLFLPLMGSVAAIEMLDDKWQKFFYWIPFYWGYKANDLVLSNSDSWSQLFSYVGIVLAISAVVVAVLTPHIRRGLE